LGASDISSTFVYQLGSVSKTLTFSNVKTRTRADLNSNGTLLPFIKINTSMGNITGIDYKWMKKDGITWTQATSTEVKLLVQDGGAMLNFYVGQKNTGISFRIPSDSATGTIQIGESGYFNFGINDPTHIALTSVCGTALSYDDQMGLRIFAGAPQPNGGPTCP
jgi:hypothetical protein